MQTTIITQRLARLKPAAVLFIASLLSYGLLIPWLGFYWDDWPAIWFRHFLGPAGFTSVFTSDRPLLGYLFRATMAVLGESPLAWQIFGLLTRYSSAMAFWWLLRQLWPRRQVESLWAGLLFAVYPGFSQQYISVTYSHVFILMAAFLTSLGVMVKGLREGRSRWAWYLLSWLLSTFTLFSVEYFFGLELLRLLLIWLVLRERNHQLRSTLPRTLQLWAPYAASLLYFLYWRLYIHITPRGEVQLFDRLLAAPLVTLSQLLRDVARDTFEAGIWAWIRPFNLARLVDFGLVANLLYFVVVAVVALLAFWYLKELGVEGSSIAGPGSEQHNWAWLAIGLGISALLSAGWPFWTTNLPIELRFPWDRFTLPMIVGSSLLLAGGLALLSSRRRLVNLLLSILIAFAIGVHFEQANLYRREWVMQKNFFWQMAWRAPEITPGTVLLTSELPFLHYSDNSLTAPLNWTYYPAGIHEEMPLLLYALESRLGAGLPNLEPEIAFTEPYRATSFHGSTSQALVLYYQPPGCVYFLDPELHQRLPQKPKYLAEAMKLSNLAWIEPAPAQPAQVPAEIIGPPTGRDWCYYFEKADLARQQGDWLAVTELGSEAFQLDQQLYEINAPEFLPYIEAYARTADLERAEQLTRQAYQISIRMNRSLCDTWQRVAEEQEIPPDRQAALLELWKTLGCVMQ